MRTTKDKCLMKKKKKKKEEDEEDEEEKKKVSNDVRTFKIEGLRAVVGETVVNTLADKSRIKIGRKQQLKVRPNGTRKTKSNRNCERPKRKNKTKRSRSKMRRQKPIRTIIIATLLKSGQSRAQVSSRDCDTFRRQWPKKVTPSEARFAPWMVNITILGQSRQCKSYEGCGDCKRKTEQKNDVLVAIEKSSVLIINRCAQPLAKQLFLHQFYSSFSLNRNAAIETLGT